MKLRTSIFATSTAVSTLAISPAILAQPAINWFIIANGGGSQSGGVFELNGTVGQPAAGTTLSGGAFTIIGGYWSAFEVFCPADFNRNGSVDFFDYLDFVQAFDSEDPRADFNRNGTIDFFDYLDFVQAFDTEC